MKTQKGKTGVSVSRKFGHMGVGYANNIVKTVVDCANPGRQSLPECIDAMPALGTDSYESTAY